LSQPSPMQIPQAIEELRRALQAALGQPVDPLTAEWSALEPGIARLLGGAFNPQNPNHGGVAFLVAAALGERLCRDLNGFWFPNRAAPAGAAIGFADALIVVSPLDVALQALSRAQLGLFEQVKKDLSEALGQARAQQAMHIGARKLGPDDFRRFFDPGLLQFMAVDQAKAQEAWHGDAGAAVRDISDALSRLPARVPEDVKKQMRDQLVGTLQRLDQGVPLGTQVAKAPPLLELVGLLAGQKQETRFAPAELWQDILLPLLHIGAVKEFPPLDEEEVEAFKNGAEPLLVFVESVPFKTPVADEDGLLGVFPPESISLLDPAFQNVPATRLLQASVEPLKEVCRGFDVQAMRASIETFTAYLVEKAGQPAAQPEDGDARQGPPLREVSLALLSELCEVVKAVEEGKGVLCLRRATEAEASSEPAISELRQAMQAPRIILA